MRIKIVDSNGNSLKSAVESRLSSLLQRVRNSGKLIQDGLLWTTRNHFSTIYPGSTHYSPDKVQPASISNGTTPTATIDVDVPGVTRAYHDLIIKPRFRRALTIPMHRSAYGRKASSFTDTFVLKKKNGSRFIVQNSGSQLVFLYVLKDRVFQRQDSRLMPSDNTYGANICSRITAYLDRAKII